MNKGALFLLLFLTYLFSYAQEASISGFVKDETSGGTLIFASCYDSINKFGLVTNAMGHYILKAKKNKNVKLEFSHLGYRSKTVSLFVTKDTIINVNLKPKEELLEEVIVSDYASFQKQDILGKVTVPIKTITSIPSFAGVPDLMKGITFIPGISGGREGYSNIYVRGGDRGQNLILLDGIKLYNTNHVGGFLSLLNSDVLKQVDVYKGGFPARYGGRASSVIDVYSKDGDQEKIKGKFNIGVLNSGAVLEGPINKRIRFIVGARTSYYNLLNNLDNPDPSLNESFKYSIYDINGKLTWQPNQNHKVSLSIFSGGDKQTYFFEVPNNGTTLTENSGMKIKTTGISLLHRGSLTKKLSIENLVAYSDYQNGLYLNTINEIDNLSTSENINSFSDIKDFTIKSRLDFYQSNAYAMRIGLEASYYNFNPGIQNNTIENEEGQEIINETVGFIDKLESIEASVYQENEIDISSNFRLNLGVRAVNYQAKDVSYFKVEPRLSARWLVNENLSLKGNFTIVNQFNHVLVNNIDGFEREIWFSSTKDLAPEQAIQTAAGIFYSNQDSNFDVSLEVYYKKMSGLFEYRSPLLEEDVLDNISNIVAQNGVGRSRGIELYAKKSFSKLNLNLNYTLSWTDRQFDELNNGDWYPFLYDRRHDFSLISIFNLNSKYSIGANFIYTTGAALTLPTGFSKNDAFDHAYFTYDGLNNRRLPAYHRLDFLISRKNITKKQNISTWTLNVFNVYARQNPVFIYYDSETGKTFQKTLFSIIPTLNYSFKF